MRNKDELPYDKLGHRRIYKIRICIIVINYITIEKNFFGGLVSYESLTKYLLPLKFYDNSISLSAL